VNVGLIVLAILVVWFFVAVILSFVLGQADKINSRNEPKRLPPTQAELKRAGLAR